MTAGARSTAEAYVYSILRRALDSPPYEVIPSVEFVVGRRGGGLSDGELDLLLFHPDHGILVLEVKGGGISYNGNSRRWYSVDRNGDSHPITNPFGQGQKAVRAIKRRLENLDEFSTPIPFVVGYAVAFPNIAWGNKRLPMNADRDLIIDSTGLTRIEETLDRVIARHRNRRHRSLTKDEASAVRREILYPTGYVIPTIKSAIDEDEIALKVMTDAQKRLIQWLEEKPQAAIKGYAGTGKTVLAVEKARRLAAQGLRVAFLCFNVPLARDVKATFESNKENVDVSTYHALCLRFCNDAGVSFDVPQGDPEAQQRFWDSVAHERLISALEHTDQRYDAIVVDEGQDFRKGWWLSILGLLNDQDKGYFYIFFDPKQSIYCKEMDFPVEVLPLTLNTNCRNTKKICEFLRGLSKVNIEPAEGMPEGKSPRFIKYENEQDQVEKIEECVQGLLDDGGLVPADIVCLSTHSRKNSCLRDATSLAGEPVTEEITHDGGRIRFSSLHRFKGLEANVILLCDVTGDSDGAKSEHLYVATSRAKHRVFIFHDKTWKMPE